MNAQDANEEQVERSLYKALIEAGLLIPTTEEEVEIAERLPSVKLPASLERRPSSKRGFFEKIP